MQSSIPKIPAGTRIYLTKKKHFTLYIQPDKTLFNDNLYVAYDVKVDGIIVIPKGTRVIGDWITESMPTLAAQFQVKRIYLDIDGQDFSADSDIIDKISSFNDYEVDDKGYLYKTFEGKSTANITRRSIKYYHRIKTLSDNNLNSIYLEIDTTEIPITLLQDFIAYPL